MYTTLIKTVYFRIWH